MRWQHFRADMAFPVLSIPAHAPEGVNAFLSEVEVRTRRQSMHTRFSDDFREGKSATRVTRKYEKQWKSSSIKS